MKVPDEIIISFYPEGTEDISQISGGIVNATFVVVSQGKKSILQRLNSIYSKEMVEDYDVVARHLIRLGWEVAKPRRAVNEEVISLDLEGELWRSFEYIESDGTIESSREANLELSSILGRIHKDLGKLSYVPKFSIPNFHNTDHFARELNGLLGKFNDDKGIQLANALLKAFREEYFEMGRKQLIHGDPKLANALFRGYKPFTLIDWDTLMVASPLVDLGDMLRSVIKTQLERGDSYDAELVDELINTYLRNSGRSESYSDFRAKAIASAKLLSIELSMRYLIDSIKCELFDWDDTLFSSQKEHNFHRANLQYDCYLKTK